MAENFIEKVQKCGDELNNWASKEFGSVRKRRKELSEQLALLQKEEPTEENILRGKKIEADLEHVLKNEETMWFQRSRALWLKDGDRNTAFFHQKASLRKRRNTIKSIEDENGQTVSKQEAIAEIIRDFFINLFRREDVCGDDSVLDALEGKVTTEMNEELTKPYTIEEVQRAIKQMHPAKAPGPDGMTPLFYQKFWHLCKNDVVHAILGVLNLGHDPAPLNHTHIILIPKSKTPKSPSDFRPISLSNVVFRIITKMIANRVKLCLPVVISESQSAFIPGRLITDNAMTAFEVFHAMKNKKRGKVGHIAMKLDMSKAYDRVNWVFLERVMLKLGFCTSWTSLVMRCIKTVTYSVIVNGRPTDAFRPERGLRQGDPLSPFLFLFCAEAFSGLLRQAEKKGLIHGMKVAKNAPPVSHLFFADDTILFTRATREEANEVKQIIKRYEEASGQRINLDKTAITASSNVTEEKKKALSDLLGVRAVEQHTKYLGLPTLVGKTKKQIFASIVDSVTKKMKDWKEKSLSQAGKEVLIKTVIQSIPTYTMNCFLLPITTCQEIEKATARFFWGSTIEDRKHHWAGWDILTTPKAKGGIGFRELHFFNLAMLAKQLWRLIINPNSLAYRILKAKYFPRVDILQAQLGYNPSYIWRSLLSAMKVIEEGRAWRIGNGASVNIINERWIGVQKATKLRGILPESLQNQKVCHLINLDNMQWRETEIMENFDEEEAMKILSIPLSTNETADRPIWRFTKHGFFTVKSAYHCAVDTFSKNATMRASPSTHQKEWKKIWEIKTSPRVKVFLWRACTNSLPTRANLCRRGSTIDPICSICGEAAETTDHIFLRCRDVVTIWYSCALRIEMSRFEGLSFRHLLWDAIEHCSEEFTSLLSYTAWEIWRARNSRCFEDKVFDGMSIQQVSHTRWMEEVESRVIAANLSPNTRTEVEQTWQKPHKGRRKLNCDAAEGVNGNAGLGFVLRDDEGKILLAGKKFCLAEGSSTLIEAIAMRYALKMARQYHYQVDRVESDSQVLIKSITGTHRPEIYCDTIIHDIQRLAEDVACQEFAYIPRKANQAAHQAAKGHEFISIGHTPSHLREVVVFDASS